ncbi:hypothetical protein Acr_00g0030040 [Actinidia rufa]|uniref:F-box domain-containing protein n=1 Tax=Actinidia rufa TaxID=165716 RepID=A0A7J0DES0_9ERIC|nr:hypothetical protein Acr_00g0030040 [Actinidia rufa]
MSIPSRIQMIEDSDESEQTHEAEQEEREPGQDRGIISDYSIPIHIVLEILLRLPLKTLLNCRLVCKEWLSLISDPQFANFHLSRSQVVRSFRRVFKNRETGKRIFEDTVEAEICALGEGLWRRIERVPTSIRNLSFNAFLNGSIHWLSFGNGRPEYGSPFRDFIYCFDFGTERFQTVPGPSEFSSVQKILSNHMHVGVLRGCLSICDQFEGDHAAIWVMKDYGVKESWSRDFVILKRTVASEPLIDYYEPIRILGNGKILILLNGEELLLYDPEMECYEDVHFCGITSKFHGISYVPSLVSLENVAKGENLKSLSRGIDLLEQATLLQRLFSGI